MSDRPIEAQPFIFTIGHSNQPIDEFIRLLEENSIAVLLDVRSYPRSKYAPQFDRDDLKTAVASRGMKYTFYGDELGGRPQGDEYYDSSGFVLYDRVAESPLFLKGISKVETGIQKYRVAMLCSEENPMGCHRRLLVGRVLAEHGVQVLHIRGDGRVQTEEELSLEERLQANPAGQQELFEMQEGREWKSIRSVSPKKQHPSSSAP